MGIIGLILYSYFQVIGGRLGNQIAATVSCYGHYEVSTQLMEANIALWGQKTLPLAIQDRLVFLVHQPCANIVERPLFQHSTSIGSSLRWLQAAVLIGDKL